MLRDMLEQGGPEECVFHDPCSTAPKVPTRIQLAVSHLPVQMPSFRTVACTLGLYQGARSKGNT